MAEGKGLRSSIDATVLENDAEKPKAPNGNVTEAKSSYITGLKLWLVVASVTIVGFLMLLDMSIIVTAIPSITSDFQSLGDVGWYGGAYLLANCALQPSAGKLYTQFSPKYTFMSFLIIFEVGSIICGAARSSAMLIVGRAIAGMGGSGLTNGALTILAASAPKHQLPALMGVTMGLGQIAIVCGPLIGGLFTQHVSWRWCFYINLPIGAAAGLLLLVIRIPDRRSLSNGHSTDDDGKAPLAAKAALGSFDVGGFLIFSTFTVMVSLAIEWGGSKYVWRSPVIIGLFCGGGVALIAFMAWERFVGDNVAMIPYSIACRREVWCSCFYLAFFSAAMFLFSYYLPIYFQAVKGVSPTLSGVYMLPGISSQVLMAIVSGFTIGKTGYFIPWALASSVISAVAAGLMSTLEPDTAVAKWVMYQFIGGFGRGCGMQVPLIAIQNSLSHQQSAIGISLAFFGQTFAGSIFLHLAKLIFTSTLVSGLRMFAPTVDTQVTLAAGASAFREVVAVKALPGVLRAYAMGVDHTFYLAVGASAITLIFALGMSWRKIEREHS